MALFSCKGCTSPKRYPGCHAVCPEYLADRARYDELKEADDKRRRVKGNLIAQRDELYHKAMKCRRS